MGKKKDKQITRLDSDVAEEISAFLFSLGNQFVRTNNSEAAFDCFKYCVDLNPRRHEAVYNLATLYNVMGDLPSAHRIFREALRMSPTHLMTSIALAEVSRKLNKLDEAERLLKETLAKDPNNLAAASAKAILHYDKCELALASDWNRRALELNPGDFNLILNKALIGMTYSDWPQWWGVYEECLSYGKHNSRMRKLSKADAWQGEVREGQTLLVVSDQGSGDAIQFARFLGDAKELGKFARLIYLVQPDVVSTVSGLPGIDEAVGFGERERIDRDAFSSLLGIMRILRISTTTCGRPDPILPDANLTEVWRSRTASLWDGRSLKVALCWAGDPGHGNDLNRSIGLAKLLPLLSVPSAQFFSFQVGKAADQLNLLPELSNALPQVHEVGSLLRNYADTAAALSSVDLLITVDTSVAHLAGAMGVPTWLLAASPPEWRWGLTGTATPWYPSVELFRQSTPKDWAQVVEAVRKRLELLKPTERGAAQ